MGFFRWKKSKEDRETDATNGHASKNSGRAKSGVPAVVADKPSTASAHAQVYYAGSSKSNDTTLTEGQDQTLSSAGSLQPEIDRGLSGSQLSSIVSYDSLPAVREPTPENFLSGSRFRCMEYINRGATSFVVMAVDTTTDKKYALKFIPLQQTKSKYIEREILNQFKLKHPHVIKLEELFTTEDHLVLVLEYADKGDLFSYIRKRGRLREDSARWFFQQLILAIDFCHKMGVVNRDIKLENVLLSSVSAGKGTRKRIAKLSDFGFSKDETRHSAPNTRLGTLMYIAPEIMTNKPNESYDARKTDVWSAGVVLYVMLAGQYPFLAGSDGGTDSLDGFGVKKMGELLNRTVTNDFERLYSVSDSCHELLLGMLEPDPHKRIGVEEVMNSKWFQVGMNTNISEFNDKVVVQLTKHPRVTAETEASVRHILQGGAKLNLLSLDSKSVVSKGDGI